MMTLRGGTISCVKSATSAKYPSPGAPVISITLASVTSQYPAFSDGFTLASRPPKSDQQDFVRYSLCANDFYGALGMASDEFRHAAQQETLDAASPMRTNDDQIGTPLCCGIDDSLS